MPCNDNFNPVTEQMISSSGGGEGGTDEHNLLNNREFEDQHPISAITGLSTALANLANINHTHLITDINDFPTIPTKLSELTKDINFNELYFTESEITTLLSGKADTSHTHTVSSITDFPTVPTKLSELTKDINFNELYFTEAEITTLLSGKADTSHTHTVANITDMPAVPTALSQLTKDINFNELYFTESEITTLLAGKADTSHTHVIADISDMPAVPTALSQLSKDINFDERYYTESEITTLLAGKANNLSVTTRTNLTCDFTSTDYIIATVTGNVSFTLSNVPTNKFVTALVKNTDGGVVTLPNTADVKAAATYTHSANGYREYSILYDGTTRFWQVSEETL